MNIPPRAAVSAVSVFPVPAFGALARRGLALCLLLALSACTHIQLIGDYDEVIDQGVSAVQHKAEAHVAQLRSTPATLFTPAFYDDVDADLATLATRAQATPQYGIVEQQLAELRSTMNDMRELDRLTPRPVTADAQGRTALSTALSTAEQQVRQILRLELALKRGESGAAAGR